MAEKSGYQPPFHLTNRMMAQVSRISELLAQWKAANRNRLQPRLRRGNRIRTLHASLSIEQNSLSLEQVTGVLDGRLVIGTQREIREVKNADAAYERLDSWKPHRLRDLLAAHKLMMRTLADDAGRLRAGDVGIVAGIKVVHMAPPANRVPLLIKNLLRWLETTDAHPLIASTAFHYEFEFIHPFSDGNGRMGRMWQTLILSQWQPMLAYLPVEAVIKKRQKAYYSQLGLADRQSDCTGFIEFLLHAIERSLQEAIRAETGTSVETPVETPVRRSRTPQRMLEVLRQHPELTLAELAAFMGRSLRAVERAAAKLQADGKLRHVGSRKSGRWRVIAD